MTVRRLSLLLGLFILILLAAATLARKLSPEIDWRITVVNAKLQGELPELPWSGLIAWLRPRSPVHLAPLTDANSLNNLHAAIQNPLRDATHAAQGREIFLRTCASCHGSDGRGNSGPSLIDAVTQKSDWHFLSTAKWGRAGTPMQPQPLDETAIWEVHAYLRQAALGAKPNHATARKPIDVTAQRLLEADRTPAEWLTYAGNYRGFRHSQLTEIDKKSVKDLRVAWVTQLRPADRELQMTPIVVDGVMFVTESGESVVALDATTGRSLWTYRREAPAGLSLCCGTPNRGVAVLGGTVYFASIDAHLVALDADTGRVRWDVAVADYREGYSMTSAPLALPDRVVVGIAGGEFGARGFLAAYDPEGRQLWRFKTVPEPGEPGSNTWAGDSWKRGGVPTPTTGAYDAEQDLVIWGTGNPSPSYRGTDRKGDNLYSNSVIAIEGKSGTLKWHYQFTPHDEHDWDSNQQPVLADIPLNGVVRPVVLWANRNGFFYALDRRSGDFLFAKAFALQSWNVGFDEKGRPRMANAARPSAEGTVVWPAVMAATNWWPPSFDASRNLFFVPSSDAAGTFFRGDSTQPPIGSRFEGGAATHYSPNHPTAASVKAIDALTGQTRWRTVLGEDSKSFVWTVGGVLSTAGGVTFAGYREDFYAFDSDTGKELWRIRLGGKVRAGAMSYALDGHQYISIGAGNSLFTFSLPPPR